MKRKPFLMRTAKLWTWFHLTV